MSNADKDKVFAGSIPKLYETYLVPLIFEPYAADLANRLAARPLARVLEIAAGTGVVTRMLASVLADDIAIVATDLNQPMLDQAAAIGTKRPVEWRHADAMQLPFPDATFDAVVCQFGVMFFPDKAKAYAEARRVLRPRGVFIFNVWDRIEENEFADTVTTALESVFPNDPPRFMARTPHGYHDRSTIERDLANGGFTVPPQIITVAKPCKLRPRSGDRVLPGHAATERDRGARRRAARRSNRRRGGSSRPTIRAGRGGWQDPGARGHPRNVTATRLRFHADRRRCPLEGRLPMPYRVAGTRRE
jgi:SAM-dependent methyltransferase